jgi:Fe/S biogenesis protein NfuA
MTASFEIGVTEKAKERIEAAMDAENLRGHAIRMAANRVSPVRIRYRLVFAAPEARRPDDLEVVASGVKIWIDPASSELLNGATVDFVEDLNATGFCFSNPNESEGWSDPVAARLQELLDQEINPSIAAHGGTVDLIDYQAGKAYLSMGGGCQGCGMANVTLREGIEARVREVIPEISEIIDTTDHSAGVNPYHRSG